MTTLTPEEMRIAIAEAMGWRDVRITWKGVNGRFGKQAYWKSVPDYCNDLNACREAIASLTIEQRHAYCVILSGMFWPNGWTDWLDTQAIVLATPQQHCEAIVGALDAFPLAPRDEQHATH